MGTCSSGSRATTSASRDPCPRCRLPVLSASPSLDPDFEALLEAARGLRLVQRGPCASRTGCSHSASDSPKVREVWSGDRPLNTHSRRLRHSSWQAPISYSVALAIHRHAPIGTRFQNSPAAIPGLMRSSVGVDGARHGRVGQHRLTRKRPHVSRRSAVPSNRRAHASSCPVSERCDSRPGSRAERREGTGKRVSQRWELARKQGSTTRQ